jgi:hypothetical protein
MSRAAVRCRDYSELLGALNARRRELGLTMEVFDELSGLTNGYSAKVFCGMRRFGPMSLSVTLATLGLELLVAPKDSEHARPVERRGMSADKADRFEHRATTEGN